MPKRITEPAPGVEVTTSVYARNSVRSAGRPRLRAGMLVVREDVALPLVGMIRSVRADGRVAVTWFNAEPDLQVMCGDGTAELPRHSETLDASQVAALRGQLKAIQIA